MSDTDGEQIFISYATRDYERGVDLVVRELKARGFRVFLDRESIRCGDSIPKRIEEGLEMSSGFVRFYSSLARDSRWVEKERQTQECLEFRGKEILCFPVLLDDVELPTSMVSTLAIKMIRPDQLVAERICDDIEYKLCGKERNRDKDSNESEERGNELTAEKLWNESIDALVDRFLDGLQAVPEELRGQVCEIMGIPNQSDLCLLRKPVRRVLEDDSGSSQKWRADGWRINTFLSRLNDKETIGRTRNIQLVLLRLAFPKSLISEIAANLASEERKPCAVNSFTTASAPRVVLDILAGFAPCTEMIGEIVGSDGISGRFDFEDPPTDGNKDNEVEAENFIRQFLGGICVRYCLDRESNVAQKDARYYAQAIKDYIDEVAWSVEGKRIALGMRGELKTPLFYCFVPVHKKKGTEHLWEIVRDRMVELLPELAFFVADVNRSDEGNAWSEERARLEKQVERFLVKVATN